MFKKYMHLERFGTDEVEGIDIGICYIFPKLDGTNSSVWQTNGEIKAGSRNRELTLDNDNQGFFNYIIKHEGVKKYLERNKNHILYGEWLVPHSLKTYRDDAWRKFYVFDVYDTEQERYLSFSEYCVDLDIFDIQYLNPLLIVNNPSQENISNCLAKNTFLINENSGIGEGVVIKNYGFKNKYGRTVFAKVITNEFKEKHQKEFGVSKISNKTIESEIVNHFVTKSFIEKELAKIKVNGWSNKSIPRLLNTIFYELVKEESWNFVKKFNNPTIDFKKLWAFTTKKVKDELPEIF
ncbi:RNA ligase family protein [Orbaceae bacterium ac157xtp]